MSTAYTIRFTNPEQAYKYASTTAQTGQYVRVAPAQCVGADTVVYVGLTGADEFADAVKQLCKDFSDRHDRPYMGDVHAAIDSLLAQFQPEPEQ